MTRHNVPMTGGIKPLTTKGEVICDGCKKSVEGDNWVILADGNTIHYGGKYGLTCFKLANPKGYAELKKK